MPWVEGKVWDLRWRQVWVQLLFCRRSLPGQKSEIVSLHKYLGEEWSNRDLHSRDSWWSRMIAKKYHRKREISGKIGGSPTFSEFFNYQYLRGRSTQVRNDLTKWHSPRMWISVYWLSRLMSGFGIPCQYHWSSIIDHLFARRKLQCWLQFISEPCHEMLEIPREKVCAHLLDDYFVSNIDCSLLQDEYQPRLRCDAFRFSESIRSVLHAREIISRNCWLLSKKFLLSQPHAIASREFSCPQIRHLSFIPLKYHSESRLSQSSDKLIRSLWIIERFNENCSEITGAPHEENSSFHLSYA
jgi:hypothetical protein